MKYIKNYELFESRANRFINVFATNGYSLVKRTEGYNGMPDVYYYKNKKDELYLYDTYRSGELVTSFNQLLKLGFKQIDIDFENKNDSPTYYFTNEKYEIIAIVLEFAITFYKYDKKPEKYDREDSVTFKRDEIIHGYRYDDFKKSIENEEDLIRTKEDFIEFLKDEYEDLYGKILVNEKGNNTIITIKGHDFVLKDEKDDLIKVANNDIRYRTSRFFFRPIIDVSSGATGNYTYDEIPYLWYNREIEKQLRERNLLVVDTRSIYFDLIFGISEDIIKMKVNTFLFLLDDLKEYFIKSMIENEGFYTEFLEHIPNKIKVEIASRLDDTKTLDLF